MTNSKLSSDLDYNLILKEIYQEIQPHLFDGVAADYIPALADVPLSKFGMSLRTMDHRVFHIGDATERFSIQSIAKVFNLSVAMKMHGDAIWERVGREPAGTAFNSLVQLESDYGIPRNPFLSAGALVVLDLILEMSETAEDVIAEFVQNSSNSDVQFDSVVENSEKAVGQRNRALAHFLRSLKNLRCDPNRVLEAHFKISSLSMSCDKLTAALFYLSSGGVGIDGQQLVSSQMVKRINALMLTCGVYDEAGDYAYRVGLPAKSGVGGGVVAVMPGQFVVAAWSPGLNKKGNSIAGTLALELLTTKTGLSVF